MRLLRLQDIEIGSNDRVFRHARLQALIIWLAGLAATTASFLRANVAKWPPGYIFGSFLLLFMLFNVQDGHGAIPSIKLARPEERDGNLRAISLLDFLACFPVK